MEVKIIVRARANRAKNVSSRRFTVRQKAILGAHYNAGMKGVGELYSTRIASAAREAGLQVDQVKVAYCLSVYHPIVVLSNIV